MLKFVSHLSALFKRKALSEPELAALISELGVVDSRVCGLIDAVQSGLFNHGSGELAPGFQITDDDVVLDVGCGDGAATLFAARCGAEVIFSDSDADKIARLAVRVKSIPVSASHALVCDTNPLPLSDERATRIIAMEMLEHVDDPAQVLAELVRVGQPGALYLLAVPDPAGESLQKQLAPASHFQKPNHIHVFEHDAFEAMIIDAGLHIERRHAYSFYWSIWMCLYWACERTLEGATLDKIKAPYPPLLNAWAKTWHQLISMPNGGKVKEALDQFLPKSQIIIARKPR